MSEGFAERVFIITGSTQGLGEEIALALARRGAAGVVICGRNHDRGQDVAAALQELGAQSLYVPADLAQVDDCRALMRACDERFGRVDGLVNSAASTARGTIFDTTPEAWDAMMALNLRAPFLLIQGAVAMMRREGRGGSIVNIGSVSGNGGQPKLTAYCTSKGALAVLTKNVAYAVRPDRIRVNQLNIGWTATPAEHAVQKAEGAPDDWLDRADARAPLGRILRPHDVVHAALYLLGDHSEMMTGAILELNQEVIGAYE